MLAGLDNLTVGGLPAHPLVVHAIVVGVPVMALASWLMLARSSWRLSWAWPIAVIDVLIAAVAVVARSTGQGLQAALGGQAALEHAEFGNLAPLFALVMALGAVAFAVLRRRGRTATVVGAVVAVATSLAALVWIVLTGHSGSASSWGGITLP